MRDGRERPALEMADTDDHLLTDWWKRTEEERERLLSAADERGDL